MRSTKSHGQIQLRQDLLQGGGRSRERAEEGIVVADLSYQLVVRPRATATTSITRDMSRLLLLLRLLLHAVLLLLCVSATPPVLAAGHNISRLPGFHGPLPFQLETGYVGVGEEGDDVQLFYYFIPSERNLAEDPLLVWITGGPGCSALSGLAFQIGPFSFLRAKYDGSIPTLVPNPYSWTKIASIIFLDSPVGTGFSFAKTPEGYSSGDMSSSIQVTTFIRKWLDDHPQFKSNPFYVGGDSYSGMVVPVITDVLSEGKRAGDKLHVNLKGYLVGNPFTGGRADAFSRVPFLHGMGIISDELYEVKDMEGDRRSLQDYPNKKDHSIPPPASDVWCRGTVKEWQRCNNDVSDFHYKRDVESAVVYHSSLTGRGYRALVYSGDHDAAIPFIGTQLWIRTLNSSIVDDWRSWSVDGQVAG
ncbi:hypothetical protein Taro_052518 [Colocasia esculenta]|uniref:Uncharacterized protein n=1 Tax=Colocasia esculenta TaxID=4460 RepID=A0A843XJX4_COLES|nr:hypothetical protein [Colocasia esculenta]